MPQSAKLNILSDLHLGQAGLPLPQTDADIVVLAGDIARPQQAAIWASGFDKPVLYVAGNHEFYGSSMRNTIAQLRHYTRETSIQVLDNQEVVLKGIRFLGSTLWTDFNLYGDGAKREQAISESLKFIRDFVRIQSDHAADACITPDELEAVFKRNCEWLENRLNEPFPGPTVVITHHAPSTKSIHPRFEGSLINTCFVSNNEHLMGAERVALWIHGHTHDSYDYTVNGTRVVCNPRGYAKDGVNENPCFDAGLTITVGD